MPSRLHQLALWLILLSLVACDASSGVRYSTDQAELIRLVKLDLPINTVRWEVFSTPESTGLVPGPTDYVTLIAEIAPAMRVAQANPAETAWITPGSARRWLSPDFRAMFTQHSNSRSVLRHIGNCAALHAELTKSGKKVQGFLCSGEASSVVYLTLHSAFE